MHNLLWKRRPLKNEDTVYIADYFVHQNGELLKGKIIQTGSIDTWLDWVKFIIHIEGKPGEHYFGEYCSPDVWGAKVIATYYELVRYKVQYWFRGLRENVARKIYPEGF